MKYPLAIFTAAVAAIAGIVRNAVGDASFSQVDPDAATAIPRMTPKLVESLAIAGGTDAEIADRFLVDAAMIRAQYADVLRSTRAKRAIALRGFQFELARKLNASALTWLGRNELGQSLNPGSGGEPIPQLPDD